MKYTLVIAILFCLGETSFSQTKLEKSVSVKSGQKVRMDFEYPELITVRTWDKDQLLIKANVSINKGENDDAFQMQIDQSDKILVSSRLKDYEALPKRILMRSNDIDYYFSTSDPSDPEVLAFKSSEEGRGVQLMKHGVLTEIELEIFVPDDIDLSIYSKFGLIEVKDPIKHLEIHSKFRGIDVSFPVAYAPQLTIETKFGEVYSNLEIPLKSPSNASVSEWNRLSNVQASSTDTQVLVSEFGNIYLRKVE